MTLHLKIANRRLRSQRCTEDEQPNTCWEFFGLQAKDKNSPRPIKRQLLSILLTCRQVYILLILTVAVIFVNINSRYAEAKEYLYSENVFDSLFSESVLYLPRVILPQRLTLIRSLYFFWYLKDPPLVRKRPKEHLHLRYDKDVWTTMWQNLTMMTGLTDLGIQLYIDSTYHDLWTAEELKLLQAVKPVTAPKNFDLYLPFRSVAKKSQLAQFPCKIIRTSDSSSYP